MSKMGVCCGAQGVEVAMGGVEVAKKVWWYPYPIFNLNYIDFYQISNYDDKLSTYMKRISSRSSLIRLAQLHYLQLIAGTTSSIDV